ncbi:MAG TPA: hypothetical protein VHB20_00630 [Verrucomicrobiae bacterium]|jgi:glucuronoarabinoxylan endo-1,4-beta-xylanase|nr:hypothetical protein [Verrucomicrobiae bacterium]
MKLTVAAALLGLAGGACAGVVVDWNDVHQRIDGFGASSAWSGGMSAAQADSFFSTNKGLGLSLIRSRIYPGGATSAEATIMQMAVQRGARAWSTPWTPPGNFKDLNTFNGGNYVSTPQHNSAYAGELAAYVKNMKTGYGVDLYAISVQNEPTGNHTNYESCVWTAQQIHDFIPYLAAALASNGVSSTKIMAPENESWSFDLATPTLADPVTAALVGVVAGHDYGGFPAPFNTQGKPLWETEVALLSGSDNSITNGIYWAKQIHTFLTTVGVNAWHYWWLISGDTTGNEGLAPSSGLLAKRAYVLGQFSRWVRPNFYRVGASYTSPIMASAFKDSASTRFAVVAINPGTTAQTTTVNLAQFTADSVVPYMTTSNLSLAVQTAMPVTNSSFSYTLPAMSVVTFTGAARVPALAAASGAGGLTLSWPTNTGNYLPETATGLPSAWTAANLTIQTNGDHYEAVVASTNEAQFFRLSNRGGF